VCFALQLSQLSDHFGSGFQKLHCSFCWQVFLDEEITELKRRRKELKAEVRLAAAAAKNLKRRRNKLLKVRQPEFVLCGQHVQASWSGGSQFIP